MYIVYVRTYFNSSIGCTKNNRKYIIIIGKNENIEFLKIHLPYTLSTNRRYYESNISHI